MVAKDDSQQGGDEADSAEGDSGVLVISAILLGLSTLLASIVLTSGMDRNGLLLATALRQTQLVLARAVQAAAPPAAELELAKEYTINTAGSPSVGPASAKVTLVEFGDFYCPYCARATPTLRKIRETYGDDVRIVFKHLPLRIHPKAMAAHLAAEAAHRQGKFWPFHNKVFVDQASQSQEKYLEWAAEIGLDMAQFERDLVSADTKAKVDSDQQEAIALDLRSTPVFFLNGTLVKGAKPSSFSFLKEKIDQELGK